MVKVLLFLCLIPTLIEGQKNVQHTEIDISRNLGGIITSPGYPGNYPNNVNYTWTMKTGNPKATITFNITDFTVVKYRFSPICDDYLQIKRIQPTFMKIIKRCGEFTPFNLESNGTLFTVTFVSDSTHNSRGFNLSWRVYISDTTTTTTILSTTTTKIIATEPKTTKVIKTITTRTTTATTTSIPRANMPTSRESQTLTSALMTSITTKQRTYTNVPFKNNTKAYEASIKAHTTVKQETLHITAASTKKISTMLSMQPTTAQKSTIGIPEPALKQAEIIYLVIGIGMVELSLVAMGIYIVKQRRANTRHLTDGNLDKEKVRPVSRKSVVSVGNVYESIPVEHFSMKDTIPEEDESVYTEVPEYMYDKTFEHRPHVNVNTNLYQLISELKSKSK